MEIIENGYSVEYSVVDEIEITFRKKLVTYNSRNVGLLKLSFIVQICNNGASSLVLWLASIVSLFILSNQKRSLLCEQFLILALRGRLTFFILTLLRNKQGQMTDYCNQVENKNSIN